MNRIGVIISIVMLLSSMVSCKDTRSKREILEDIYKDYSLTQYMKEYTWLGLGDTGAIYSPDSILYNGLDIQGKSYDEIKQIYDTPFNHRYDTLYHGISIRRGKPSVIYPMVYQRDSVPVMYAGWLLGENELMVWFETYGDSTKVIYGYQLKRDD